LEAQGQLLQPQTRQSGKPTSLLSKGRLVNNILPKGLEKFSILGSLGVGI
jgi:hypothetical protein